MPDKIAEAYNQFMLAHHLEANDDVPGAIAAYKRAMALDPTAADIPAELAALYMRQNRAQDALETAEQALKIAPDNFEAHRVAGIIYAALSEVTPRPRSRPAPPRRPTTSRKAITHLAAAIDQPDVDVDPNVRATLARLYLGTGDVRQGDPASESIS